MSRKKKVKDIKDLRRPIERRLRLNIPNGAWMFAVGNPDFQDIFSQYRQGDDDLESLVEWIGDRLNFAASIEEPINLNNIKLPPKPSPETPREHQRAQAFIRMVETYINSHPKVLDFRGQFLGGNILESSEEAVSFLRKQSNEFKMALIALTKNFNWLTQGGWVVSEDIIFITLTGKSFYCRLVKVNTDSDPLWGYKYVVEISPHASSSEVIDIVTKRVIKEWPRKSITRKLSDKTITLAEFVLTNKNPWENRMEKWNEKFPKWKYKDRRHFARDAKVAVKRAGLGIFTV